MTASELETVTVEQIGSDLARWFENLSLWMSMGQYDAIQSLLEKFPRILICKYEEQFFIHILTQDFNIERQISKSNSEKMKEIFEGILRHDKLIINFKNSEGLNVFEVAIREDLQDLIELMLNYEAVSEEVIQYYLASNMNSRKSSVNRFLRELDKPIVLIYIWQRMSKISKR
ncbi:MAG: hypothetical protein WCK49_05565 [Myxococcaceae bacterium]